MTSRKKRRSSLYARRNKRFADQLCDALDKMDVPGRAGPYSAEEVREALDHVTEAIRRSHEIPNSVWQRRRFLDCMRDPYFRAKASWPDHALYAADVLVAVVFADGESILQRLGCLLPKRERDALIGDAIEAVRLQHLLSVGKPWRKFAVLATTAFWAGVIVKSAVLFAVFSHLPKRSR